MNLKEKPRRLRSFSEWEPSVLYEKVVENLGVWSGLPFNRLTSMMIGWHFPILSAYTPLSRDAGSVIFRAKLGCKHSFGLCAPTTAVIVP
jgi:hypothetical protein